MIADFHFDPRYQYDIDTNVILAYKDDKVSIYNCSSDEQSAQVDLNEFVPGHRCYRVGGKETTKSPIKLKYSTRVLKLVSDTIWIIPASSGIVYELLLLGPAFGHDFFNNASADKFISLYEFRLEHPELEYIFNSDIVRPVIRTIPALGGNIAPEKFPVVFEQWKAQWQADLISKFTANRHCDYTVMSSHSVAVNTLCLPKKIIDERWNLLPYVIADELQMTSTAFIDQIIANLTIDNIDIKTERSSIVRNEIRGWAHQLSATRILNKLNGSLPESSAYYMNVVANYISEVIIRDLDTSLLETIRQYNEE